MKVIVAGSRNIYDYDLVGQAIEESGFEITEIVSGCARGVDRLGEKYAFVNGLPVRAFPANWNRYGKKAGYLRNERMATYADAVVAVWDGQSKGTKHMIDFAKGKGLHIFVFDTSKRVNRLAK